MRVRVSLGRLCLPRALRAQPFGPEVARMADELDLSSLELPGGDEAIASVPSVGAPALDVGQRMERARGGLGLLRVLFTSRVKRCR